MSQPTTPEGFAPQNLPVIHPQPRHLRLTVATLAAAGNLTPEAISAIQLAGAFYRATPIYDAWQTLYQERTAFAEAKVTWNHEKADLLNRIQRLTTRNRQPR